LPPPSPDGALRSAAADRPGAAGEAEPGAALPGPDAAGPLPVGRRPARAVLLGAVFLCAACGLVYELALVTLGSYLVGNSVQQTSVVLGVFVFAMGLGSLAARWLTRRPVRAFAVIEALLGLLGGLSVLALYAAFAWLGLYTSALVAVSMLVGALIGAEIPLLVTLVQQIRRQAVGEAVADLFAADYVGALAGGLAFPFLLLPLLGQIRGALVTGAVNALAAAAVVVWLFGRALPSRERRLLAALLVAVLALLGGAFRLAGGFEASARQALYEDPIVAAARTPYQEIVVTEGRLGPERDVRLFLNGDLQFSSVDEHRYHEALVHPAMAGRHASVLVLGGGDGLALREVLRYPDVRRAVVVELDPQVPVLARTDERLRALNRGAFDDPRARLVAADAFAWLRGVGERFDVVVVDLPDPDDTATAKLYSAEFYALAARALAPGGRMVVQAGSPYFAAEAYWCVGATLREAGLAPTAYHVDVPSFGDWGFHLAARGGARPPLALARPLPPGVRSLDEPTLRAAAVFPADRRPLEVEPSTLMRPRIVDYERRGWHGY
jgi:spermidine synthase